jgi:hypothetical protein
MHWLLRQYRTYEEIFRNERRPSLLALQFLSPYPQPFSSGYLKTYMLTLPQPYVG